MSPMEIQRMVSHYAQDHEPRVRKSALDSLVQMHLRGCPLDLSIYQLSVSALRDDYEEVRMGGLNLMGVLSSLYPEHRMKLDHEQLDETVRLIDDAFNKVCDLVNDATVVIRTKACVMMASYQNVGSDMLQQTFSKQIMSHLKRNIPRYKQQQKKYTNGVIPVAEGDFDVESDEFHILDSGACGAFIHGLEDEYQEVRYASIDSICELCMYNEELTKKAVENLVDMFNDEIDKIRVNAIQSLRKIGTRSLVQLDEEQLEIAVGAFEDSDPVARHASHDLLTVVRLTQKNTLATLLEALEANMKRYPQDILSIYRSLGKIGKRHDDYMEDLTPSLLKLDKRYLPREANVDDLMYTAYVILIANACVSNHKLLRTLPKYIFRHFAYFKSKYPECLPNLRKLYKTAGIQLEGDVDCLPMTFSESEKKRVSSDAEIYMKATENMLETLQITLHKKSQYDVSLVTLDAAASRNFKYVASLKPVDSGKSELAQLYIECYKIMIRMKQSHLSGNFSSAVQKEAALLFKYAYTIEYTFLGLPTDTLHAAAQFRLLATLKRVELVQKRFQQSSLDPLYSDLEKAIESPNTSSISALYSFITTFLPLPIPLKNLVKQSSAVITSPLANPDKPYSYISAYPLKLDVEADVFNIDDVNSIAVEIVLPDQSSHVFWPSPDDFRPNKPLDYTLSTHVELSLSSWQSVNAISIRIIISFEPDLPGLDEYIMAPGRTASSVVSESVNYRVHPQ
ncbi:armadillo-type protein [Sporodiniella umbellata]|nr:armadillo-type protein [Sporodiniella umbellata]